ncbi:MAG: response regulator [Sulfuritalea sp.]|nr:response regulator [Sulfuritalea sp.]
MIDLSKLNGLLIDDIPEMRSAVRIQLTDCGLEHCDAARNIKEAIEKISANRYDLIICDYNLGQGADGQQLLELVRRRKILPLTTVFLMITGETGYEQVSTAAEYSPDDYLIKPFTSQTLQTRLQRVIDKKLALRAVYVHLGERGDKQKALAECDAMLAQPSRYSLDVMRIKGEVLLDLQRNDDALALYQAVLDQRATPWASVGKARALAARGDDAEAREHLDKVIDAYPNYLAAYDSLTLLLEKNDRVAAQKVVERALKVAPSTQRQRQLGTLALDNKDFTRAEDAFRRAVDKDRSGFFKSHDDYSGLAKSQVEQGKVQEALAAVKEMGQHFGHSAELTVHQAAVESIVHAKAGNPVAAKAALERALKAAESGEGIAASASLELANACFASGDQEQAKQILQGVAEDHQENEAVLDRAQAAFRTAGLDSEGEIFLEATRKRMITLNNDAVAMAKAGELDQASAMLDEAADRLRNNAQVSINAAIAALMKVQRQGVSSKLIGKAHRYITQAHRANPEHPRLDEAVNLYRKLAPADAPTLKVGA